jgi:putative ATPase
MAINAALAAIERGELQEVPMHLRPGGKGYLYPHDSPGHWVEQKYMDKPVSFYRPGSIGEEPEIVRRHNLKRDGNYSGEDEDDTPGDA